MTPMRVSLEFPMDSYATAYALSTYIPIYPTGLLRSLTYIEKTHFLRFRFNQYFFSFTPPTSSLTQTIGYILALHSALYPTLPFTPTQISTLLQTRFFFLTFSKFTFVIKIFLLHISTSPPRLPSSPIQCLMLYPFLTLSFP